MQHVLPSPRQLKRCSCPIIWRLLPLHPYFLNHTTIFHHAFDPLLLRVPAALCVFCVSEVGSQVVRTGMMISNSVGMLVGQG